MTSVTSGPSELLEANFLSNCAFASGAALIFYEHITTLDQEVKFFWRKRSFPAVLFFINRLVALVYGAISIAFTTNIYLPTSCEVGNYALYALSLAMTTVSQVAMLQQVYAVTDRDWRATTIIAFLAVAVFGIDIVYDFVNKATEVIVLESTTICYNLAQPSFASTFTKLTIASLVISVVGNAIAVGVIWRALYKQLSWNL